MADIAPRESGVNADTACLRSLGVARAPQRECPTDLYWSGLGAALSIFDTPLGGAPTRTLVMPQAKDVDDMALASDGTLYWTTDLQVQSIKP
jgi:hypothetical protein